MASEETKDAPVKIQAAVWQGTSKWGEVDVNIATLKKAAEKAANADPKPDILVFPEQFLAGYPLNPEKKDYCLYEKKDMWEICRKFQLQKGLKSVPMQNVSKIARENSITLVLGFPEFDETEIYDSAVAYGPDGSMLCCYRKTQLWDQEAKIFTPGKEYVHFCLKGKQVGILICYDAEFPEPGRVLTLRGCDILVVITAYFKDVPTPLKDEIVPTKVINTLAAENDVFLLYSGHAQQTGQTYTYCGQSAIIDYAGKDLKRAGRTDGEVDPVILLGTLVWDDDFHKCVNLDNYIKDRRPSLYDEIVVPQHSPQHRVQVLLKELGTYIAENEKFRVLLLKSLKTAKVDAKKPPALKKVIYDDFLKNGCWPTIIPDYMRYLKRFALSVPRQLKYDGNFHSDYVCQQIDQFYYLIDQNVDGKLAQNESFFSNWIVKYCNAQADFLNTPASINQNTIQSFIDVSEDNKKIDYRVEQSLIPLEEGVSYPETTQKLKYKGKWWRPNNPSGWISWNQFFARQLNPNMRYIEKLNSNSIICAACDSNYKAKYNIDKHSNVIVEDSKDSRIILKQTTKIKSIPELIGKDSNYAEKFAGGTFVHYYLSPYSYHWFHMPVDGMIVESRVIQGKAYCAIEIKDGQFSAPDNSDDGYEFTQTRGVFIIDTTQSPCGNVGLVAVIPVGMSQVSSVNLVCTKDEEYTKGTQAGYFQFGGSDYILLFQKEYSPDLVPTEKDPYFLVGTKIATIKSNNL